MPNRNTASFKQGRGGQRGAALMVILVLLVVSVAAILVNSLTTTSLKNARKAQTAAALAQAKEALIAYAVSDANRPGELPCPDFNNDGMITITPAYGSYDLSGSNCTTLVGWLPWQTLGLPDLRDGNGDRLWYALANPFHANGSAVLNSDTPANYSLPILNPPQMLTVVDGVTGTTLESGVIAIVFSPGVPLPGQARSANDHKATTALPNYLEADNANLNTTFQTANSTTVNDGLLTIGGQDLFPPVERRIAREAKACLDSYALASAGKYPWAAPVTDSSSSPGINLNYNGTVGKYFGRIPAYLSTTNPTSAALTLMTALNALQAAESTYQTSSSSANQTALQNAANTVIGLKYSDSNVSSTTIDRAGDYGNYYANGTASYSTSASYATTAVSAVNSSDPDSQMSLNWPATCTVLNNPGSYFWTAWKNLVFFQIAGGYQPGGSTGLSGGIAGFVGTPLIINGAGTYRATVLIARAAIGTQLAGRSNPATDPPTPYLEGINPHSGSPPSTAFNTYSSTDPNYATVNDLVLCLNGGTSPCQ